VNCKNNAWQTAIPFVMMAKLYQILEPLAIFYTQNGLFLSPNDVADTKFCGNKLFEVYTRKHLVIAPFDMTVAGKGCIYRKTGFTFNFFTKGFINAQNYRPLPLCGQRLTIVMKYLAGVSDFFNSTKRNGYLFQSGNHVRK
jgi:hypothetical protein